MLKKLGIIVVLLLSFGVSLSHGDTKKLRDNKQDLEQIKKQLKDAQNKIDSLKNEESDLQKAISTYGERVNRNNALVNRMEKQLSGVRGEISTNDDLLKSTDNRLQRKKQGYADLLIDYYQNKSAKSGLDPWDFAARLAQSRKRQYLAAISGTSTREMIQVGDSIKLLTEQIDNLQKKDADLDRQRRQKKAKINLDMTLKQKEETNLGTVRRQKTVLRDRLVSLSEVAREMEDIIARLEEDQKKRRRVQGETPRFSGESFAQLKGSLIPPIRGKIISSFGWKTDKYTKLKSFSPGIDIKPSPGHTAVATCAPGRVVYVGTLRGYRNFVIVEHDDDYYTTYAGLENIAVELDDLLDTGQPVGTGGENQVHFEIRKGREHLDPVIWLDINGF